MSLLDPWHQHGPVTPLLEGLATAILGPIQEQGMEAHWDHWMPQWKQISGEAIYHAMNNLLERDEITHRLVEITCPVFVTHGDYDHTVPPILGEELSKQLPGCRGFATFPGCHAVNLTHSKQLNPPLKNFLSGIYC